MAEALARHILGPGHEVFSAGSRPTTVNPLALRAMQEVGLDITQQHSKSIDAVSSHEMNWVISLCEEECPVVFSQATRLHWPMKDPASVVGSEQEKMEVFRDVRDALDHQIREWLRDEKLA